MFRSFVLTALLAGAANAQFPSEGGLTVGQEICVYGYIMDYYCVQRGTLLDAPDVVTLENPELHSLHCLLDVPSCVESPYHVLEPPGDNETMYGTGWQVSDNTMLVNLGRQLGSDEGGCTSCGEIGAEGDLTMGFYAEVRGTVNMLESPEVDPSVDVLTVTAVEALDAGAMGCLTTDAPGSGDAPGSDDTVAPSAALKTSGYLTGALVLLGAAMMMV